MPMEAEVALLIADCILWDGSGSDPLPHAGIWVRDRAIHWTGPMAACPAEAREAPCLDATGLTAIPGLIDAHLHVCWNGREPVHDLVHRDRDALLLEAVQTLGRILASGTTAVRDVGGQDYMEISLRRAVQAGHIRGPRMRAAGKIICMTGGHGHVVAREADGPEEVRKAAREQIKAGADLVKLMATGGAATPGQDVQATQLTVEEMAAAVQAAHAMGRRVAAHCHGTQGILDAVAAGVDSVEHGTYLTEEAAQRMVDRGTALVLTLGVARPEETGHTPAQQAEAERLRPILAALNDRVRESIAIARAHGVFIGAGSDAGGNALAPHDFSMAREVEHLVQMGFSAQEALTVATRNNARILGWESLLGTLEPGKRADVVLLEGNPLEDLEALWRVAAVIQDGHRVL